MVAVCMVSLLLFRLPIAILCPFIDQSTLVIDSLYKFIQLNRYLVVDHSLWSCTFQSMGNNILSFKSHYYFVALLAKRKSHIIHLKKNRTLLLFPVQSTLVVDSYKFIQKPLLLCGIILLAGHPLEPKKYNYFPPFCITKLTATNLLN